MAIVLGHFIYLKRTARVNAVACCVHYCGPFYRRMLNMITKFSLFLLLVCLFCSALVLAEAPVIINGRSLSAQEVAVLEQQLGGRVYPGNYLYNAYNGCWYNTTNRTQGCIGQDTSNYFSRYGSGERSSNGSWSHTSRAAGGSVGGTADGCVYTSFGWSNC